MIFPHSFWPKTSQNDYETPKIVTNRRFSKISITKTQFKCACQLDGPKSVENPSASRTTSSKAVISASVKSKNSGSSRFRLETCVGFNARNFHRMMKI